MDDSAIIIYLSFSIIVVLILIFALAIVFVYVPVSKLEGTVDQLSNEVITEIQAINKDPVMICFVDCLKNNTCITS